MDKLKEKGQELAELLKSLTVEGTPSEKAEETHEVSVEDFSKAVTGEIQKAIDEGKGKKLKSAKARVERIAGYLKKAVATLEGHKEGDAEPKLEIFKSADLKIEEGAPAGADLTGVAKAVADAMAPALGKFEEALKALKPAEETPEQKKAREKKEADEKAKKEAEAKTKKAQEESWPADMAPRAGSTPSKKADEEGPVDFGSDDPGVREPSGSEDSGSGDGGEGSGDGGDSD